MVKKPKFETLISECLKYDINTYNMNANDMFFALAGKSELPEFKAVAVFARNISDKQRDRAEKKQEAIPEKTVFPIELKSKVLKVIEKNPLAYNGYDFTRDDNVTNYSWEKNFECICGQAIEMTRKFKDVNTGVNRTEDVDLKLCTNLRCLEKDNRSVKRQWVLVAE